MSDASASRTVRARSTTALPAEGIVGSRDDLRGMAYCSDVAEEQHDNVVNVELAPSARRPTVEELRRFAATSACGVCGKGRLEALSMAGFAPWPRATRSLPR